MRLRKESLDRVSPTGVIKMRENYDEKQTLSCANGISVYPGLANTSDENITLVEEAARQGLTRLFTSLHIPETNVDRLRNELSDLLYVARRYNFEIISDVSPVTLKILGLREFNLSAFRMLGISTVRLDDGFSPNEIAALSRNKQKIKLQLNASTVTGKIMTRLVDLNTDFKRVDALHNFYPRTGTGLSEETLARKTVMLHKAGVRVGAFVVSQKGKRGPLFEGLPTLEDHRGMDAYLAARHLVALGVDSVFIGDSLPSLTEISSLAKVKDDQVVIRAEIYTHDPTQRRLLAHTFTSRIDEARDAIRAAEGRILLTGTVSPENTILRVPGAITIDNEDYLRYMGEIQIIKCFQPADNRVNVAAKVLDSEMFLLDYITPGRKFSFEFV